MGVASVSGNRIGPITKEEAEYIRDLQMAPTYWWGYEPKIFPFRGQWAAILYGDRDAAEAERLLQERRKP